VREESWLSSLHKVLGDDGNVAQKLRRGFQVPVGRVDIDVTQMSGVKHSFRSTTIRFPDVV
jgi:dTDP-4-dehydrorhamnose reductase